MSDRPKDLYLSDTQYLKILQKIQTTLATENFKVGCSDCTAIGYKSTDSNCGFCNDEYTDEDMALFPDQYPDRKSRKYRGKNHKCPFDMREIPGILGWGYSCFGKCYLFRHLNKKDWDIKLMQTLVNKTIKWAKENSIHVR